MRPALALAVAAVVVLAGCGAAVDGPPESTGTTTTATPTETTAAGATTETTATATPGAGPSNDSGPNLGIEVMQGDLPYDPNVTYARVQRLLGTNQSPPGAVMLIDGLAAPGSASNTGRVYLDTDDEAVLAHEFAHSVLLRAYPKPAVGSADEEFAVNALVEGAAEYVQAAYARRYLDRNYLGIRRLPEDPGDAYFIARYRYGYRYFRARANSTADVVAVHRTPPNTSEQVIHGLPPSAEPPRSLSVAPASRHLSSDAAWRYRGTGRLGEISVLLTLRTRLGTAAARRGADGWGNDRLLALSNDGERGYAWVLRWDDAANASEFARTFAEFEAAGPADVSPPERDRRSPDLEFTDLVWGPSDAAFELRRAGPETTVVLVGPQTFVGNATISGGNESVTVGVGGS